MNIMEEVKEKLKSDFQRPGLTAKSLAETGDLLLMLDERPSDLAKILLQSASRRLHEQIVMLQVYNARLKIEKCVYISSSVILGPDRT